MMKKNYIFLCFCLLLCSLVSYANPGDTTWVQANIAQLSNYAADYDTAVSFPDGTTNYRKILMYVTIGEYNPCPTPPPDNPYYCHQWDYTVLNYILTPNGDTVELSRLITPYANTGVPRFPATWKQVYTFDVTDFYPLLRNTATARTFFSGYSAGFTLDVKFAFIEGTPDRNVTGIKRLYTGSYAYGNADDPVNNHFPLLNEVAPSGTESAMFRFLVTGHGSDTIHQCCEFDMHSYDLYLNNTSIVHENIWRDDCGVNELYPQGGTWIYERSNWCPGALVNPIYHALPDIVAGTDYSLQIKFQDYTALPSTKGYGSYTTEAAVIYHAGYNKTLDASIEDIISPTSSPDHFRENPSSNIPIVRVHNSGSTTINSMTFEYGVKDSTFEQYTWNGTLLPLEDTTISLAPVTALTNLSTSSATGNYTFIAHILKVNNAVDEDATNDTLKSQFIIAPLWPGDIKVSLKTTNITTHANGSQYLNEDPSEASWDIKDMNGNIVASRTNTTHSTQYDDIIALPGAGFYKFTVYSAGCDGLHWWPYDGDNSPVMPGAVAIKNLNGANIPMNNYYYSGTFQGDFGCEFSQYFYVSAAGTSSINDIAFANNISVYPNPADNYIDIAFALSPTKNIAISLVNILGQTVYTGNTRDTHLRVNTGSLQDGIYTLTCISANGAKKVEKVVISH